MIEYLYLSEEHTSNLFSHTCIVHVPTDFNFVDDFICIMSTYQHWVCIIMDMRLLAQVTCRK